MLSLEEMLRNELPLNRKERFFTGTVFPMIVCKDNFKFLHRLFPLIDCLQAPDIVVSPDGTNILFFTEYSLVESLVGASKQRFKRLPKTKDTPDIVILIKSVSKVLIALEAKMYDSPTVEKLDHQLREQEKILESIQKSLAVDKTCHYALLPQKLKEQVHGLSFPVITWEDIYKQYEPVCKGDYFFDLLRVSLEMYDELVSPKTASFGQNCEERITGRQIYTRFKQGTLHKVSMGRSGGISGDKLNEDIITEKWYSFPYETNSTRPMNRNWFLIEDFVRLIEQRKGTVQ